MRSRLTSTAQGCLLMPRRSRSAATVSPGASRSEERRVGKEGRSLCDWSSDVCSSDLVMGLGDEVAVDLDGAGLFADAEAVEERGDRLAGGQFLGVAVEDDLHGQG